MAQALTDEVAARVMGEVHSLAQLLDRQRAQLEESARISQTAAASMVQNTRTVLLKAEEQARAFYKGSNEAKTTAQIDALEHCAAVVTNACNAVKKDMRSLANDAEMAARQAIVEGQTKALAAMHAQAVEAIEAAASAHRTRSSTVIVGIGLAAVVLVGAVAYMIGKDAGKAQGYAQARDESAAASWGNSEDGKLAFLLAKADPNSMKKFAFCSGKGWTKKGSNVCIPAPESATHAIEGWRTSN